jgi:sugar transferase (PEP-CTERM/EpsH1 system associated)
MRILLLTHRVPFPPNKGDKIRSFHILQYLAKRHEVHLATLVDDRSDLDVLPELERRVESLMYARIDQPGRKLLSLAEIARSRSVSVRYFYSAGLQARIDDLIESSNIDAVFCFSSPTAEYVFRSRHADGRLRHAPKVMDLIDVDSYKWGQYASRKPAWSAWIYRHEQRALADYERRIYREMDRVLLVSEQEVDYFPAEDRERKLMAIPNGVDLEFFREAPRQAPVGDGPTLVFTGMMDYWPNIEGVQWFVDEIYPGIRRAVPDVRLFIVGGRPGRQLRRLDGSDGITVTGFVDDIRAYIAAADVCVVPLRIARGIQNKLLEAMAMSKGVVSTPQAAEGVNAEPGRDLVVAGNADDFRSAAIGLLNDPGRAAELGARARRFVEKHYDWDRNLGRLDELWPEPTSDSADSEVA